MAQPLNQKATETFIIKDFHGFFHGISKSRLPPGGMVDLSTAHGPDKTNNVMITDSGELAYAGNYSLVGLVPHMRGPVSLESGVPYITAHEYLPLQGVNSIYAWHQVSGNTRILLSTTSGIAEMQHCKNLPDDATPSDYTDRYLYPVLLHPEYDAPLEDYGFLEKYASIKVNLNTGDWVAKTYPASWWMYLESYQGTAFSSKYTQCAFVPIKDYLLCFTGLGIPAVIPDLYARSIRYAGVLHPHLAKQSLSLVPGRTWHMADKDHIAPTSEVMMFTGEVDGEESTPVRLTAPPAQGADSRPNMYSSLHGLTCPPQLFIDWGMNTDLHAYVDAINTYMPDAQGNMTRVAKTYKGEWRPFVPAYQAEYQGSILTTNLGNPPQAFACCMYDQRLFAAVRTSSQYSKLSCSLRGRFRSWPPLLEDLGFFDDVIVHLCVVRGTLFLVCKNSVYRAYIPDGDPRYAKFESVSGSFGCVSAKSLVYYKDRIVYLSTLGLVAFDGVQTDVLSHAVTGYLGASDVGDKHIENIAGVIAGNTYYLSFYDSTGTASKSLYAHNEGDPALVELEHHRKRSDYGVPNRVLLVNLLSGAVGVRDHGAFVVGCAYDAHSALVVGTQLSWCKRYLPNDDSFAEYQCVYPIYLVSDYPLQDAQKQDFSDMYENEDDMSVLFSELDFDIPDQNKYVVGAWVKYESLLQLDVEFSLYKSMSLTDEGISRQTVLFPGWTLVDLTNPSAVIEHVYACWADPDHPSDFAWSESELPNAPSDNYPNMAPRYAVAGFQKMSARVFNLALRIKNPGVPIKIQEVGIRFQREGEQQETGRFTLTSLPVSE